MMPDYNRAAAAALQTLLKYNVTSAPIMPLPLFKQIPNVLVLSFAEISDAYNIDRKHLVNIISEENQDAITMVHSDVNKLRYIVTYNQRLPFYMLQRGLARELGHIVLGHDGSRPTDVRNAEAQCFAYHLICPRPLIRAIQQSGVRLSVECLGNVTGCYERCLIGMRKTPAATVPAELNRAVKNLFSDYLENFLSWQSILSDTDETPVADFGTFMDGYEE